MFGIQGLEFVVLLVVAMLVIGPDRLPRYAQQLGRTVRRMRSLALNAREQVKDELGPEFDDLDWRKLDPRQYDPRRIVRDALAEDVGTAADYGLDEPLLGNGSRARSRGTAGRVTGAAQADPPGTKPARRPDEGAGPAGATPFDADAT